MGAKEICTTASPSRAFAHRKITGEYVRCRIIAVAVVLMLPAPLSAASSIQAHAGPANAWVHFPTPFPGEDGSFRMSASIGVGAGAGSGPVSAHATYSTNTNDPSGCETGCDPCGESCGSCTGTCDPCANGCPPPPIVDDAERIVGDAITEAASDFGITYYAVRAGNGLNDAVTYEWHGILNASISCPSSWTVSTQVVPALQTGSSLTYNVWYSPARLQEIRTADGTTVVATGTCRDPVFIPYSIHPLSRENVGCFPVAKASPPAPLAPEAQHVGWRTTRDTGLKTLAIQDTANGFEDNFAILHARGRFCWEVATLPDDASRQPARTEGGIPFTGSVHADGAGMDCRTPSFLAGKPWVDLAFTDSCIPQTDATYPPTYVSRMQMSAVGFLLLANSGSPIMAGTFAETFQTCDVACD